MKDGFREYFRATGDGNTFEMKPYWGKIHPQLNDRVKNHLIKEVTIYLLGDSTNTVNSVASFNSRDALSFDLGEDIQALLDFNFSVNAIFISIKFNGDELIQLDRKAFEHYDFNSLWNIQISIYGKSDGEVGSPPSTSTQARQRNAENMRNRLASNSPASWEITRHRQYGEVPYFDWRAETNPQEFSYELKGKK